MPVTTVKTKDGYTNRTPGGVKGRHMTKKNAEAQKRLLNAVEHGWKPTGAPAKDRMKKAATKKY
jgi:hypothetical protein